MHTCISVLWRWRQENSWGLLTSQANWQRSISSVRDCLNCKIEFDEGRYQQCPLASLPVCKHSTGCMYHFKYSGDPLYILTILLHRGLQSCSFFILSVYLCIQIEWDIIILFLNVIDFFKWFYCLNPDWHWTCYIAQVDWNSQSSTCFCPLSARIKGVGHHVWL